jgi:hypothetical protein
MMKYITLSIPLHLSSVPHADMRIVVTQEAKLSPGSTWYNSGLNYVVLLRNESGEHIVRYGSMGLERGEAMTEEALKMDVQGIKNDLNLRFRSQSWNLTT